MNDNNDQNPRPQYQPPVQPEQTGKNLAVASLITGILSIAFSWLNLTSVICIGLGIAAVICGIKAKKKGFLGNVNTAGIVLGIVGIIISAVVFIVCTVTVCATAGAISSLEPDIIAQMESLHY